MIGEISAGKLEAAGARAGGSGAAEGDQSNRTGKKNNGGGPCDVRLLLGGTSFPAILGASPGPRHPSDTAAPAPHQSATASPVSVEVGRSAWRSPRRPSHLAAIGADPEAARDPRRSPFACQKRLLRQGPSSSRTVRAAVPSALEIAGAYQPLSATPSLLLTRVGSRSLCHFGTFTPETPGQGRTEVPVGAPPPGRSSSLATWRPIAPIAG